MAGGNPTPLMPTAQQSFLYGSTGAPATGTSSAPYSFGVPTTPTATTAAAGTTTTPGTTPGTATATGVTTSPGIVQAGGTGIGALQDIASGVDFSKLYQAIVAASGRQTEEGRASIAEWAGASGVRNSQPMNQAMVDYESQVAKDRSATLEDLGFKAETLKLEAGGALAELLGQAGMAYKQATPSSAGGIASGIGSTLLAIATAWPK
jgi:hypothetical protein